MNFSQTTGLGEPEPFGKSTLFQPPTKQPEKVKSDRGEKRQRTPRLRITTDVTKQALEVIQEMQHHHRVKTGKTLPAWKIISAAVEKYGKQKRKEYESSD